MERGWLDMDIKLGAVTPLFVFELANNHMGSAEHGLRIIRELKSACEGFPWRFAVKFQYRHLETFIHPAYRASTEFKYIKRFQETRLSPDEFRKLNDEALKQGFIPMCTPFDEPSVDLIEAHGIAIVKIASCSLTDWPLIERIAATQKPLIVSTAGESFENIDRVVSFLEHRRKDFALMHCVAEYPTPDARLELNQIDALRARYPQIPVGFSTHEAPGALDPVKLAIAKGAMIFEKHVGVSTSEWPLNAYSASPAQVRTWLEAARNAFALCGKSDGRYEPGAAETASLQGLRRGMFARRALKQGTCLKPDDVFFAIPCQPGQLTANDFSKYTEFHLLEDVEEAAPLFASKMRVVNNQQKIWEIVQAVKALLKESRLAFPSKVELEISHHYGIGRFYEFGLTLLEVVNRIYCKKLLVLLPGQRHPEQYHRQKEETFSVLYGDVQVKLDGKEQTCRAGEIITVERGVKHEFASTGGAVIEEISTTHFSDDSFYTDPAINRNASRKTRVTHWIG